MKIRKADLPDLEAINRLMHESSAYGGEYAAMLEGYNISKNQLENDLFYVATESKKIAGFYSLIPNPPELDHMFVSDEFQGKGIGRMLFRHLIDLLQSRNINSLKIVSHPPSAEFYQKMGAKQIGWQQPNGKVTWRRPILQLAIY